MTKNLIIIAIGALFSFSAFSIALPQQEKSFVDITIASINQSDAAKNDMQRGGIKARRDDALCVALKKRKVFDWIGKIIKVDSNSEGRGVLTVEVEKI